jgi:hypothetical protein
MVWSAKSNRFPARLRGARDPCRMTGFRCYLCAQCSHDMRTCSKADRPGGERTADVRHVALPEFHA